MARIRPPLLHQWLLPLAVLLLAVFAVVGASAVQNAAPSAQVLLDGALARTKAENKAVFVDFYASWCGPCRQLDAFLNRPETKLLLDEHFVVVRITISERGAFAAQNNPGGDELMDRLGGPGGIPYYAALAPDGTRLASGTGFPWGRTGVDRFRDLLDAAAPRMTMAAKDEIASMLDDATGGLSTLAGRVTSPAGVPAAGASVTALVPHFANGVWQKLPSRRVQTDKDGYFVFDDIAPGSYWIVSEGTQPSTAAMPTFFGDSVREDEAARITLQPGQSVTALDVALRPASLTAIAGTVTTSAGSPGAGATVTLTSLDWSGRTYSTRTDPRGAFSFDRVLPGHYHAWATVPGDRPSRAERGFVRVDAADGESIAITTTPEPTLSGIVIMEDETLTDAERAALRIAAVRVDPVAGSASGSPRAALAAEGTFTIFGARGKRVLRVEQLPPGWVLKSVTLGEYDITDRPLDEPAGGSHDGVRVVITNQSGEIAGEVVDGSAAATSGAVIVFAADAAKLAYPSRFVRFAAVQPDGSFTVRGLPAADYLVTAVRTLDPNWQAPDVLDELREGATPVAVAGTQPASVTLTHR